MKKYRKQDPKVLVTKNRRIILSLQCAVHDDKKLRFNKQQEANGITSSIGL